MCPVPPHCLPATAAVAVALVVFVSAPQLLGLFLMDEKGSPVLLCDESVYSRNRNFRLYLSSKLGKGIPLLVAKENKFKVCL